MATGRSFAPGASDEAEEEAEGLSWRKRGDSLYSKNCRRTLSAGWRKRRRNEPHLLMESRVFGRGPLPDAVPTEEVERGKHLADCAVQAVKSSIASPHAKRRSVHWSRRVTK